MRKRPSDEEVEKYTEDQEIEGRIKEGRRLQKLLGDDYYKDVDLKTSDFGEDSQHFKKLRQILKK